jgi:peptide/nickel transport system substrate-binding protein
MDANEGLIIPAHAWEKIPYAQWQDTDWVGNALSAGPFLLSNHSPQQEIVLERNPGFWQSDRPFLDRVVWRIIPDQVNLLIQFRSGEVDFINQVPPRQAERIRNNPSTNVAIYPDRSYTYIGWNSRKPLFSDPRVRRALTMAIDRTTILGAVRQGYGRIAVGPILSAMWAFNRLLEPLPYDPEGARTLLAEVGWEDHDGDGVLDRDGARFEFELLTNSENQERKDVCVLVHDQLERIGIEVRVRSMEFVTTMARRDSGDFDAVVSTWREPTQIDLEDIWHTAPAGVPTSNFVGYSNPDVDRLIVAASELGDAAEQKPLYDRIQEIIVADQPYTFLYERDMIAGISARIGGAVINDATPYFNLEEWYVSGGSEQ